MTWQNHEHSRDAVPDRDFRKLNKMCVTSQLHKADQYYQFRKSTDARVSVKKGSTNISMHLPEENFRYGKPYAPQSPMKMILANDYANQAEEIMTRKYDLVARQQDAAEKASRPKTTTKHTKASRLCTSAIKERLSSTEQKTLFKLSQFDNVAAKTQTRNFKTQPKN